MPRSSSSGVSLKTFLSPGRGRWGELSGSPHRSALLAADASLLAGRLVLSGTDLLRRQEAVLDHRVVDVGLRDRDRLKQHGRGLRALVVARGVRRGLLSLGERD